MRYSKLVFILFIGKCLSANWIAYDKDGESFVIEQIKEKEGNFSKEKKMCLDAVMASYSQLPGIMDLKQLPKLQAEAFQEEIHAFESKEPNVFFVRAKKKDEIIGFMTFDLIKETSVYIRQFAVAPCEWRKGIGRALVKSIFDIVSQTQKITLVTRRKNTNAIKFYQKLGFQLSDFQHEGYDPIDWVGMKFEKKPVKGLVDLRYYNSSIATFLVFATLYNFTGKKIYQSEHCYVLKEVAEKLDAVQKELNQKGTGLLVIDAYRPPSAQQKLWNLFSDKRYVADPKKGSIHSRGGSVDVLLIDMESGKLLPLPITLNDLRTSAYFNEKVHHGFMDLPAEQIKNRELLKSTMIKHGFESIPTEFWHYNIKGWQSKPILNIESF